ncbi:MAG: hydrogenobyrinic/cobyrinic acid a,c-diamide synthase [Alphaproteobacteria bacterium]
MANASPRGLIIAAPRSGAGKTTIALGLMRALRRQGLAVQPFKCGPDYIDPAFHSAAAGRTSINLDTWAMRAELISALVQTAAANADLCIVEGVMGLFDGAPVTGQCGRGSTADLAALTGWPVLLVLDVWAQAETAAAVALGCNVYRDDVQIAGVILNGISTVRHEQIVASAIRRLDLPPIDLDNRLNRIADAVSDAIQINELAAAASSLAINPAKAGQRRSDVVKMLQPPGQRIALAQDRAFSFIYPHLLEGWRAAGAEIIPFSPLANEQPAPDADAIWLPGGYPELHAAEIAQADRFKTALHAAAARGIPIHGECGGYMVLGTGLQDANSDRHEMVGLLGLESTFATRKLHLGYRRVRFHAQTAIAIPDAELFGHEFHYATVTSNLDQPLADVRDATGATVAERGSQRGSVTGTFFHLIDRGDE